MLLGEKNLEITITRIQESLKAEKPAVVAGSAQADRWALRHCLGRLGFVDLPAVRRHHVIFYYSNVLWEAVGFTEKSSFVITVITSITNILTTLIAIALIDKVGRKPLLLVGSTAWRSRWAPWR
jgi:hypothetical protein